MGAEMLRRIPYLEKKSLIQAELLKCAQASPIELLNYSIFGLRVGIPSRGPWKPILDLIGEEETKRGRPDITYLVINKSTGFPGQISLEKAKPPSAEQKATAKREIQKIIDKYSPESKNPY
jgi:hypothetical protein